MERGWTLRWHCPCHPFTKRPESENNIKTCLCNPLVDDWFDFGQTYFCLRSTASSPSAASGAPLSPAFAGGFQWVQHGGCPGFCPKHLGASFIKRWQTPPLHELLRNTVRTMQLSECHTSPGEEGLAPAIVPCSSLCLVSGRRLLKPLVRYTTPEKRPSATSGKQRNQFKTKDLFHFLFFSLSRHVSVDTRWTSKQHSCWPLQNSMVFHTRHIQKRI